MSAPADSLADSTAESSSANRLPASRTALALEEHRTVVTGELKSQIDKVWNAFWTGGIANPVEVIEQITYLLFIRRLDDLHTLAENKANRTGQPIERG
jgi:hypothetical protein